MEEIFDSVKAAAIIHKSGGGTGFAFSRLRPKDDLVRLHRRARLGARCRSCACSTRDRGGEAGRHPARRQHGHPPRRPPDVLEFIECKLDGGITNFNISVAVTDAFMDALAAGGETTTSSTRARGEVTGRLSRARGVRPHRARGLAHRRSRAWSSSTGSTGARPTPRPSSRLIEATNPCGEQPLAAERRVQPRLAQRRALRDGRTTDGERSIDWDELERVIRLAVRFLDDVIEMNPYPLPQIDATVKANRRIGLGIMGWADLLFILGIPYDSQEALDLGRPAHGVRPGDVARPVGAPGRGARAVPELRATRSIGTGGPCGTRTVTTIAPTGTISMIAGLLLGDRADLRARLRAPRQGPRRRAGADRSSARRSSAWPRRRGFYSDALMAEVVRRGSLQRHPRRATRRPEAVFKTAHEIDLRVARAPPGGVPAAHRQRRVARPSTCPTTPPRRTWPAPICSRGSRAASASRCSATAARASRCCNVGVRADGEAVAGGAAHERVVKPRPHSLAGRHVPDGDADRHRLHHRERHAPAASRSRSSCRSARPAPTPWRWPRRSAAWSRSSCGCRRRCRPAARWRR